MIFVDMKLHSAISEDRDENLCRVEIINDGTGGTRVGNYDVYLYARNNGRLVRSARVENYDRNGLPAWRLLAAAMKALEEQKPKTRRRKK